MLMLGHKPEGCHTEQHDVFFTIAENFLGTEDEVRAFKPQSSSIHIDAWREVTLIKDDTTNWDFRINVVPKGATPEPGGLNLFFINLGGYKKGEFNEFHYPMLVVAESFNEAKQIATKTAFFKHTGFEGAPSHVDDKYGVDVDDACPVKDILPEQMKEMYSIDVEPLKHRNTKSDEIHLGYQRYEKIKK